MAQAITMHRFSINVRMEAVLTATGALAHNVYEKQFPEKYRKNLKAGDTFSGPLWEAMNIFGDRMYQGGPDLFKSGEIELEV